MSESEARLWALIEERGAASAPEREAIDKRIWDLFGEEWAILFTDLAGFSRQVERFGIVHFLQEIHAQNQLLCAKIAEHDGILLAQHADSLFAIFRRTEQAVRAALAMQHACQRFNVGRKPEDKVLLCCGVGHGRVLRIGDHDVWGLEVNAASKLGEDIAQPDEILLTEGAAKAATALEGVTFVAAPELRVAGSATVWRVLYPGADGRTRGAGKPRPRTLGEVALFTPRVPEVRRFYEQVLGQPPVHAGDGIALFRPGDATVLVHARVEAAPGEPPCEDHFAIAVDDLDRAAAALVEAGFPMEVGPASFDWGRSAYVRDPDGRLVELSQRPSER